MAIYQDGLLLWIVADPANDCRRKVQHQTLGVLLAKRDELCLDTELVQLGLEPATHLLHVLATLYITADTVHTELRSALFATIVCNVPWNSYCLREAFDEGFNVSIDIIEKLLRCRHSRGYCLRVKTKEDTTRTSLNAVSVAE